MYKYLFGPVPSRRLGMSLGVDLVPHKVCSLNCVYCECGRTTNLTLERKEYIPYDEVVKEIAHYLEHNPAPDYITFSGSGEPTLNVRIGDVLHFIKTKSKTPVAVLTNGSLFYDKSVRTGLLESDVVLPSLDAAEDSAFRKINRPFYKLDIPEYIRGLIDFRKEYKGQIWLEVLIIPGLNDTKENLQALKEAFLQIQPEEIQLNTLDRPGAVENIRAATRKELQEIVGFWDLPQVKIIAAAPDRKKIVSYRDDMESAILETIRRRPCTLEDMHEILGLHINEINKYLDVLEDEQKIISVRENRGLFYRDVL
ncbi:MAG TPA: radical SAM protein [Bacteroidetes bacterium]|nr:radical SAM protein [Bacteroidota bacterium]